MAYGPRLVGTVLLVMFAPVSAAHAVVDAKDFEVHLLEDEKDDAPYLYGGYDIGNVYIAEVHEAGLGDGLYFHVELFGEFRAGPAEWSIRVAFNTPMGPIAKTISTTDGRTFESDFTKLKSKQTADLTDIERAFLPFESGKLEPGTKLSGFVVESYVGQDLRDRAPGPLYVPGSGGNAEMLCTYPTPSRCEWRVVQEEYVLGGDSRFIHVRADPIANGFHLQIKSLLKENDQHVHVDLGDLDRQGKPGGWKGDVSEGTTELKGGETWEVDLTVEPMPAPDGTVAPLHLNVTTDIGGRVPVTVSLVEGRVTLAVAGAEPILQVAKAGGDAGGVAWLGALVSLVIALRRLR